MNFFYYSYLSKKADLKDVIVGSFTSDSEDIKTAASYSLGKYLFTLFCSEFSIMEVGIKKHFSLIIYIVFKMNLFYKHFLKVPFNLDSLIQI